jgi:anti-anti-sigma factor
MALARLEGPLDSATTAEVAQRLGRLVAPSRRLVLDLRLADYLDSTGVRALLALQGDLQAADGELRLVVHPASRVERTLTLLQLQDRFPIFTSASEAWMHQRN